MVSSCDARAVFFRGHIPYGTGAPLALRQLPNVEIRRLRSSILPFAVGTVASKGMDRLSTFLSYPVVKKKRSQLPVGGPSAPDRDCLYAPANATISASMRSVCVYGRPCAALSYTNNRLPAMSS